MHLKLASGKIKKRNAGIAWTLISMLLIFVALGCSMTQSQTPENYIRVFLKKYIPHIDPSIADFYTKEEQPLIRNLMSQNIQEKQKEGTYDSLKNATYDLSNIRVTVLDRKGIYIDDQPKTFVEIVAKGFYTRTIDEQTDTLLEEELFVLQAIGGEWKVTNKIKPWK